MANHENAPAGKRQRIKGPAQTQVPPPSYQTQPGNPAGGVGNPPAGTGNPAGTLPAGTSDPASNAPAAGGTSNLNAGEVAKKVVKVKANDHHVRATEWPEGYRPTKNSVELILRYLGQAFYQDAIPPAANADDIVEYNTRFTSEAELNRSIQAEFVNHGAYINEALVKVQEAEAKLREVSNVKYSTIATNCAMLSDDHKLLIFELLAAAGLRRFAPDVHGSHFSMYNITHERVALHAFRIIAAAGGLAFMGCDIFLSTQGGVIARMYRNFQFSRIKEIILREARSPGAVAAGTEMSVSGKRCKTTALKRKKHLVGEAFQPHTVHMVEDAGAVSDEEPPPKNVTMEAVQQAMAGVSPVLPANDPRAYIICEKEGRNPKVTVFVRDVDAERRAVELRASNSRAGKMTHLFDRVERLRQVKVGGPAPKSKRTKLPVGVPLDYYDPVFFNGLTIRERNDIANAAKFKIGLPKAELCVRSKWGKWKGLDYETFMNLHGNEQLELYDIPTRADMRRLAEYEELEKKLIAQLEELDMIEEEIDPEANDDMELVTQ
ncbi:hypothetical protein SCHPADRAFT_885193 [Schizopora paradoxa]|uniref:Uncharacterized protein n=1 Tax=Schizopora paradoxa TaxID=27342 RepID=A0A0H2S5T8_9AGAM|nr:hypothetical protein SCHPADRAFT_885193 [Schizopora paradoxa]